MPKLKVPHTKHSVARQVLDSRNVEMFAGQEQILKYRNAPRYDLSNLTTAIEVVPDLEATKTPKINRITNYEKLRSLGFSIISKKARGKYFKQQHVKYLLARSFSGLKHINHMPSHPEQHHAEFDTANMRLRLVGRNAGPRGRGKWVYIEKKIKRKKKDVPSFDVEDYMEKPMNIIENVEKLFLALPEEPILIEIPELPTIVTDAGELVCIPQTKDEPTLAAVGQKRSGKSFLLHSIVDRAYWKKDWDKKIVCLNDSLRETGTWSLPNKGQDFIPHLNALNETPRPLPIIHIHPMLNEPLEILHEKEIGFVMSLPFKQVMQNFPKYFDLEKSQVYFEKIIPYLLESNNLKSMLEIIDEYIKHPQTKDKIYAHLTSLFNKKIMDINTDTPSSWRLKTPGFSAEYNPITACLVAGVIPVLDSGKILTKKYYPQYFRYIAEDIFQRQSQDPYFRMKNLQVWVVMEEILDVAESGKPTVATEITKKMVTQGGPKRIGFLCATQNFSKIEYRARTNMKYVFTFVNPGEANLICSQYNIASYWRDEIKSLGTHECVAITTEEFVVYTPDGKKYKSKGPFKGKAVPTLSLHKAPMEGN